MRKILNAEEGTHTVEVYSFKPLDFESTSSKKAEVKETISSNETNVKTESNTNSAKLDDSHIKLIEELLSKSDMLNNGVTSLQSEFQQQAQECEKRVNEVKETSYQSGYNEGYNKAKSELENDIKSHLSKLIESIHKVEEVYKNYQHKIDSIEDELVGVAIDIAEQVIAKEVKKSSKEIALSLTKELINDIKEASKIEIKLNPLDYDYVKENLNIENVEISPDNAISPGGVVIMSDAGNIEGEITERFKTLKNNLLKR